MIEHVLAFYFPQWKAPADRADWNQCLCPAHDEDRPSASISFRRDAIKCQACGFKGDAVSIIMRKEGVRYDKALKRAEEITGRSGREVSQKPKRKPGGTVFGQPRDASNGSDQVPVWLR